MILFSSIRYFIFNTVYCRLMATDINNPVWNARWIKTSYFTDPAREQIDNVLFVHLFHLWLIILNPFGVLYVFINIIPVVLTTGYSYSTPLELYNLYSLSNCRICILYCHFANCL